MKTNGTVISPHDLVDMIFKEIFPRKGFSERPEQTELCHTMLNAMEQHKIALCDAGTGIGKTYSYLVAGLVYAAYHDAGRPVIISTSSIALQKAIIEEYIPLLSEALFESNVIKRPLRAVVRKGKKHYVCEQKLKDRLCALSSGSKNRRGLEALLSLQDAIDMDGAKGLSNYDKYNVAVDSCFDCREDCRYKRFVKESKAPVYDFQICNHNLLLADAIHRKEGLSPILPQSEIVIIDEAHKLPEAVQQMFSLTLDLEQMKEMTAELRSEGFLLAAQRLKAVIEPLQRSLCELQFSDESDSLYFPASNQHKRELFKLLKMSEKVRAILKNEVNTSIGKKLQKNIKALRALVDDGTKYIRYAVKGEDDSVSICASLKNSEKQLQRLLWNRNESFVLTSGTLAVKNNFSRFREAAGLTVPESRIKESVYLSPFDYERHCLLHIPANPVPVNCENREEYIRDVSNRIEELIYATHGHTLVLFTSYSVLSEVYARLVQKKLPFPLFSARKNRGGPVENFKKSGCGVLLATGSLWEGMDFPGDIVSSLIIPRLPFAVPNPLSEARRSRFLSLQDFIERIVTPDMQIKLRQGFGRAIRNETDSCVLSILDSRAARGGRFHNAVVSTLPRMPETSQIDEVSSFLKRIKDKSYFE